MNVPSSCHPVGGVADHATGYGASQALAARASFKVGPYQGVRVEPTGCLVFVFIGELPPDECACGNPTCSVDKLQADMEALDLVSGPVADVLHFLAYWAYRVAWDECMGQARVTDLVLP